MKYNMIYIYTFVWSLLWRSSLNEFMKIALRWNAHYISKMFGSHLRMDKRPLQS